MKNMSKVYKLSMAAVIASLVLVNCSSVEELVKDYADDASDEYVSETFTGQFVDTYVKGLNYTCTGWVDGKDNMTTHTGVTNAKGEFTCNEGDLVEFSVGSYVIGSDHAWSNPIKSPYDLSLGSQEAVINLAQLLQTLDDGTTEGALTIPANFAALNDVTIKLDDVDFDALMADALPNVTALVSEEVAQAHLDETLASFAPPAPETDPTDTTALESFVSGKSITFDDGEESIAATFASDGYYEENSATHFCSGNWSLLDTVTIQTTCRDEGATPTADDASSFIFNGELQSGMTVSHSAAGDLTITNIATAVNPDALESLESFVSGKSITFSGGGESMTATFAVEENAVKYYEENSATHFCSGNWSLLDTVTIQTTCRDEGATPTADDASSFIFNGELQSGMTVSHSAAGDLTITNIATAVNPDA